MDELLQHFSHEHPLIFTDSDEQNVDGVETICNVCTQKISGFAYSCKSCSFFLHKICAELPEKMSHPLHPEHSLTLLPSPYGSFEVKCDACGKLSKGFTYRCWLCNFDLDPCCALRSRSIEHKSHHHPLIFTNSDEQNVDGVETICNGCTQKISGFAYSCKSCPFFLHKICAELPEKMSHPLHLEHSLTLLPSPYSHKGFEFVCNACEKPSKAFTYHCSLCEFDLDLCCFLRSRSIEHKSHQHPLIFTDRDEQNVDGVETICNGCTQKISSFAYSCKSCYFFLHKICAELPEEMSEPLHPEHSLTLLPQSPYWSSEFICNACDKLSRGFTYHCSLCEFYLDPCCALRSRSIEHKSHQHPLIFTDRDEQNVDGVETICNVCTQKISGFAYRCKSCSFFLHKICAELPEQMSHPLHPEHPLTLLPRSPYYGSSEFRCNACGKFSKGFTCHCSLCEFDLDPCCALRSRSIEHKSHLCPLIFTDRDEQNVDGVETICNGCTRKISGFAYSCSKRCPFFLHKICAELPEEVNHPLHPEHPLTLLPQSAYWGPKPECDACEKPSIGFTYHCSLCKFNLDLCCAFRSRSIEHKSHKHPLSLVYSRASFECYACCCTTYAGFSYMCNSCSFWIHDRCASLPLTIKNKGHVHLLDLAYSLPSFYLEATTKCHICEKYVNKNYWIYHCGGCRFVVHVQCSMITKESKISNPEDLDATNSVHLPLPDELTSLIDQFVEQISLEDDKRSKAEISHFSHNHPLILSDIHSDNNLCSASGGELSLINEKKESKVCDACVRPISTSKFYSCGACNFFLHKRCAYLPSELKHPGHPHLMILQEKCLEQALIFLSNGCSDYCSGFVYKCAECRPIGFYFDVKSASLRSSIVHEVHEHPLFLKPDCITEGCAACPRMDDMLSFGCGPCNFSLHYECALLPRTIKHRYDKHPFTLFYAAIKNGPDEYYCEFCEKEIHPNRGWFYHCIDCDQSACAYCIYRRDAFPRIKWGTTHKFDSHSHLLTLVEFRPTNKSPYKFDSHPHLLTLVEFQPTNKSPTCDKCHKEIEDGGPLFKCMQCNIMLHVGGMCFIN